MEDLRSRSLIINRTIKAPADLMWLVLTTPEHIKHWWGPDGFTNTIRKMEVQEGGKWEFTMHGPDGTDYENEFIYREIVPGKKLVLDHLKDPKFSIAIYLHHEGEHTRMEWHNIFPTADALKHAVATFKADTGLVENTGRLVNYLMALKR